MMETGDRARTCDLRRRWSSKFMLKNNWCGMSLWIAKQRYQTKNKNKRKAVLLSVFFFFWCIPSYILNYTADYKSIYRH